MVCTSTSVFVAFVEAACNLFTFKSSSLTVFVKSAQCFSTSDLDKVNACTEAADFPYSVF